MRKIKHLVIAVLSLAFLGTGGYIGWRFLQQNNIEPVKVYSFDFVGMTEFWGDSKESYGPVSTDKIQTVFLSDTQTVSELLVTEGQQVQKGDLLMRFDTTLSQLELERKDLEIQKLVLDLDEANTRLKEISWMRPMSFPPPEPETEPTEPDYGYALGQSYQFDFRGGNTGSSQDKAVICWVRSDAKLDLIEMGRLREKLLKPSKPEEPKPTEPEEPIEDPTVDPTDPTEDPVQEPTEAPSEGQEPEIPTEPPTEGENPDTPAADEPGEEIPAEPEPETPAEEIPAEDPVEEETIPEEDHSWDAPAEEAEYTGNSGLTGEELLVMYNSELIEDEEPPEIPDASAAPEIGDTEPEPEQPGEDIPETGEPEEPGENEEPEEPGEIEEPEEPEEPGEEDSEGENEGADAPTEETQPDKPKPEKDKDKDKNKKKTTPYYVIIKMTENNMSKGDTIVWMGLHVNSDGSFTFFDARGMEDYTIPAEEEEPTEPAPYIDYFGSGYTYSQIVQMKEEQTRKIRELELQLKLAEADYKVMERELNDGAVYAELDGKVLSALTEEEAKLTQQPILKVSCGGGFYVEASVSELERDKLRLGQEVTISDWENGMTYSGVVSSIGDVPVQSGGYNGMDNPNASSYPFTVFVDETADLREGSYVSVSYSTSTTQNGIYLEKPFLRTVQGRSFVYVLGADGLLEERTVTTGKSLWGSYTEILDGLTADDLVAFPYGKNVRPGVPAVEGDMSDLYGGY